MSAPALDERVLGRLAERASSVLSATEVELEAVGRRLDDFQRRQAVVDAVVEELSVINLERLSGSQVALGDEARELAVRRVVGALFDVGGRVGRLLEDDSWDEVNVNSPSTAWITYGGGAKVLVDPPLFEDEAEMLEWLQTTSRRGSTTGEHEFSAARPRLSMQLPDGSRLEALWGGRGRGGLSPTPVVSIRRHRLLRHTVADLIRKGLGTPTLGEFLAAAVKARKTLLIAGGTGAGKTTMARALAHLCEFGERIITIEQTRELLLDEFPDWHGDVISLETREANAEGQGEHSLASLVSVTLRYHPDRIWLGEILRPEDVAPFLNALGGGHPGSCATLHANSAAAVLWRLQSLCLQAPERLSVEASVALIASSIDYILFLERGPVPGVGDDVRYVAEVLEVNGCDSQQVLTNQVFAPDPDGRAAPRGAMNADNARDLARAGYHHRAYQ